MTRAPSDRFKAWRNLCVAAINAGLDQRIFGLEEWDGPPGLDDDSRTWSEYRFDLPEIGRTVSVSAADIGYGEVSLHVALGIEVERGRWGNADAYAHCDLERRTGGWLQTGRGQDKWQTGIFRCKKLWLPRLAVLDIKPKGYADHGAWFL